MIGTNYFSVFFDVEFEYEVGFSLAITVFAVEGGTIIFWDPVFIQKLFIFLNRVLNLKNEIEFRFSGN